jgi:hypothetical protein
MDKTPSYCRVKIVALGQLDTTAEDSELVGATVVTWTAMEESDDIFAEVEIRGIVTAAGDLWWLSGDAQVEVLEWARYAGQPEDFISAAPAIKSPAGVNGGRLGGMTMDTPAGWPELIWKSTGLHSAIRGWKDPEFSVEEILCALAVAPNDDAVRATLLAGLKARFARVVNDPRTYPPDRYPWRNSAAPSRDRWRP